MKTEKQIRFPSHRNCTYIMPARAYPEAREKWMREKTHGCWCSAWRLTDGQWRIWKLGRWCKPKPGDLRFSEGKRLNFDGEEEQLNRLVAIHLMKWTPRIQGHAKVTGWYDEREPVKSRQYKGIELPSWAWSTPDAMMLLQRRHFRLWTCDNGYGCEISTAPEKGETVIGLAYGSSLPSVICHALVMSETKSYV